MPSDSLWLGGHVQKYEALSGDVKADVAIVGGGIAGLTAAYLLSAAGAGVAVLEAETIGSGASGHSAAHITSPQGLNWSKWLRRFGPERARLIAEANERAIHLLAGIVDAEKIDCGFTPQDAFLFTEKAGRERELEAEAEAASRLGIMADVTNRPAFLFPYHVAVRFRNQAMFHPVKYLDGLAGAVARNTGRIYERSRVLQSDGNVLVTGEGSVRAKCVVVATGLPAVCFPGFRYTRLSQRRSYAVALEGAHAPLEGAPALAGIWASAERDGFSYRMQEDRLIVCGGDHRCGIGGKTDHYELLRKHALGRFPESTPVCFWSAQYAVTQDGLPYIGAFDRGSPTFFTATGFGKWGMAQGTLAGHLLCDLMLDRKNPYAGLYSPRRRTAPEAFGQAIAMNLSAAWHVASGAARVGNPACSHLGCRLKWNGDQHSWDCPCHGSRFAEDGSVLDAPAVHGIGTRPRQ